MSELVTKKGSDSWNDLVGKTVEFTWYDGYDSFGYWVRGTFEGTRMQDSLDIRYPRYYILVDGGGVAVREDEEVRVTVRD